MNNKPVNYGRFSLYKLHNGDLQIAMPAWAASELQDEIDSNEYQYPSFDEVLEFVFDDGWDMTVEDNPDPDIYGPYTLYLGSCAWRYEGNEHPTQVLASQGYINFSAVYYGPQERTMNKISRIQLIPAGVVIYRTTGNTEHCHVHPTDTMSDASRLRLNDYLAEGVRYKVLQVVPYVGPGWNGAIITFLNEPKPEPTKRKIFAVTFRGGHRKYKVVEQKIKELGGWWVAYTTYPASRFVVPDTAENREAVKALRSLGVTISRDQPK